MVKCTMKSIYTAPSAILAHPSYAASSHAMVHGAYLENSSVIMSVEIPYFATTSSFRLSNFSPSAAAEVDDGLLPHWSLNACRAEIDMCTGSPALTDS